MSNQKSINTIIFTLLALIAFAANSVLCRLALGDKAIDAAGFTSIRLLSGILVLLIIINLRRDKHKDKTLTKGSWAASFMLFVYAITFSFAYITLDTGTGALILFGTVQITMIVVSLLSGARLHISECSGIIVACAGFVYLILPGVTAPSTTGFLLMSLAGIGWGSYTLMGRDSREPLMDTAYNFLRTAPLVILLALITFGSAHYSFAGIFYAALSGGIASGIGYTIWYAALPGLSTVQAAVVQLLVPVIAALGGVLFVSETITPRLTISAALILGGILMVVLGKVYFKTSNNV